MIVLSDEFYREITAHPIPADLEAVKVLAAAPAVLDLFMWLSYRCFLANGKQTIPLFGPRGLATRLAQLNPHGRAGFEKSSTAGWSQFVCGAGLPARISSDGMGPRYRSCLRRFG